MNAPQRRYDDPRVTQLVTDMEVLKTEIATNTVVTLQVKEILDGFRVVGRIVAFIAKWAGIIAGLFIAVKHGHDAVNSWRG